MTSLEIAKAKLDIKKLETGIDEMEYKILEREADIERIKESIQTSIKAIEKLKNKLNTQGD